MTKWLGMAGRLAITAVVALLMFVSGIWAALALWYRFPGGVAARAIGSAIWMSAVVALAALAMITRSWIPLGFYAIASMALLGWWVRIVPSNDGIWSDDVARLLAGAVQGREVTLANVRNFTWRSDNDYDIHWETRRYNLDQLISADAVLSYWGSPAIAHAMISFGFTVGGRVVFSMEIRKRHRQRYSPIGGFFKQFETILIAADERDIIRVRTNVRGEEGYLYPLRMGRDAMRALFLSYVQAANRLAVAPAFYHTITSNCTTVVYRMATQIAPGLPRDMRLLLTGYLPEYLQQVGALDRNVSIDELRSRSRITDLARNTSSEDDFSAAIRANLRRKALPDIR